jgi:ferritin-like metal-binding protein YciE
MRREHACAATGGKAERAGTALAGRGLARRTQPSIGGNDMDSLKDVYHDQLQDLYSACEQSLTVTKDLMQHAKNGELVSALQAGADGIERGMQQIAGLCEAHGIDPKGEHCHGMAGLVKEARSHGIEESFSDDDARDAMIITQYQRMAHYAIAGYGCLKAFAGRLELDEDKRTLDECLSNTYDGDDRMTEIAEGGVNAAAA